MKIYTYTYTHISIDFLYSKIIESKYFFYSNMPSIFH